VYALPFGEHTQEDFQWLLREIVQGGGEGSIVQAKFIDGLNDTQVRGMFQKARAADYAELRQEIDVLAQRLAAEDTDSAEVSSELRSQVSRLQKHLAELAVIDFFGADGRTAAESALDVIDKQLRKPAGDTAQPPASGGTLGPSGRTWVTRRDVRVDRMASAWLIQRFIDPEAKFKFVDEEHYQRRRGEVQFDMAEGEFTHHGDACTFEVLVGNAGLGDNPALRVIGEIVHDIELKDGKFGRSEAAGIALLLDGIATINTDDEIRLARSRPIFDDLFQYFQVKPHTPADEKVIENTA
jgi:hypothetical protein